MQASTWGAAERGGLSNRRRRKGGEEALLACHEAGARTTGGIDREGLRYCRLPGRLLHDAGIAPHMLRSSWAVRVCLGGSDGAAKRGSSLGGRGTRGGGELRYMTCGGSRCSLCVWHGVWSVRVSGGQTRKSSDVRRKTSLRDGEPEPDAFSVCNKGRSFHIRYVVTFIFFLTWGRGAPRRPPSRTDTRESVMCGHDGVARTPLGRCAALIIAT